ncbi:MAG: hypothetical protein P1U58_17515 [Verrucomicrobiales bacterium]|nr:hypothetical protein [Verrucomicrobiales bacterium]
MEASDWQTWAALGVVVVTVGAFLIRAKRSSGRGCSSCGDDKK